jgi:hypothetical protein
MAGLKSASLTIGNRGVWCARLDSNQHSTAFEAVASTGWTTGAVVGSVGFEPTLHTVCACCLCRVGLRACGVRGEIRTRNNAVLDRTRLPVAPPEHWWAVEDLNLGDPDGIPGLQPGAFSLSANCPNANCQRSGGRQATRTPMSRGTLA